MAINRTLAPPIRSSLMISPRRCSIPPCPRAPGASGAMISRRPSAADLDLRSPPSAGAAARPKNLRNDRCRHERAGQRDGRIETALRPGDGARRHSARTACADAQSPPPLKVMVSRGVPPKSFARYRASAEAVDLGAALRETGGTNLGHGAGRWHLHLGNPGPSRFRHGPPRPASVKVEVRIENGQFVGISLRRCDQPLREPAADSLSQSAHRHDQIRRKRGARSLSLTGWARSSIRNSRLRTSPAPCRASSSSPTGGSLPAQLCRAGRRSRMATWSRRFPSISRGLGTTSPSSPMPMR